jgi:hypothetical protein
MRWMAAVGWGGGEGEEPLLLTDTMHEVGGGGWSEVGAQWVGGHCLLLMQWRGISGGGGAGVG